MSLKRIEPREGISDPVQSPELAVERPKTPKAARAVSLWRAGTREKILDPVQSPELAVERLQNY